MADYLGKFSRSRSRLSNPRPSIHQSSDNTAITIQGPYNDMGRDLNITNITNLVGTL